MTATIIACYLLGILVGYALFKLNDVEVTCPTCHGDRVTIHAGDVRRDDGYCELRSCSACGTGERIGRSDVPNIRQADLLAKAAEHRESPGP